MHRVTKRFMLLLALSAAPLAAQTQQLPIPRIESRSGNHAMIVDGKPFLMLGAQVNNAANYPDMLPEIWPAIKKLHANTVEVPVGWEQIEPVEGQFDFSWLDTLLRQARENNVRLVLLWFGTWKNTAPAYAPAWVKLDQKRFPHMINA
ncbi:MAG: beta-galactosidase, partial [Caulobacter sp.]|nr:beta-galactosidase [Caulobacter sp.]